MQNNITTDGLNQIINHLRYRIRGYSFREVSVDEIGLVKDYTLIDVQNAAKKMLHHMSMPGYTPIIELVDLPDRIAGLTNLNDSKIVYISLDKKRFNTKYYSIPQLLTIIAHELCHKFLWVHGIKEMSKIIEYMTDACVVYVGFGKIMIQGVNVTEFSLTHLAFIVKSVGYLEKWQIAYLRNVCYNIPIPFTLRKWSRSFINVFMSLFQKEKLLDS